MGPHGRMLNMESLRRSPKRLQEWAKKQTEEIWDNLEKDHLWQRMFKNTLATTIAVIIALLPAVVKVYGKAAYLMPITTVFGHPGRRFGAMAEALVLVIAGTLTGTGWSILGIYLSSLVYKEDAPAAYTIRGIFLAVVLLVHGFLRSHTPRLFLFVLLMVIVTVVTLTSTAVAVTKSLATQLLYPILTATAILIIINILVFPEFSSSFLGTTTIEALGETMDTLRDTGKYFVSIIEEPRKGSGESEQESEHETQEISNTTTGKLGQKPKANPKANPKSSFWNNARRLLWEPKKQTKEEATIPRIVRLETLTGKKAKLRAKLGNCTATQRECNFELAWAVLPPGDTKPISKTAMTKLVENAISLIGACESKYALLGDSNQEPETEDKGKPEVDVNGAKLEAKSREEAGNPGTGVTKSDNGHRDHKSKHYPPTKDNDSEKEKAEHGGKARNKSKNRLGRAQEDLELVKPTKEIESGDVELLKYLVTPVAKPLTDLQGKMDKSIDVVIACLAHCYGVRKLASGARPPTGIQLQEIDIWVGVLSEALVEFDKSSAVALEGVAAMHDLEQPMVDIMPRMEIFLISSFILNLRQAAIQILDMLRHSRVIEEKWQARHGQRRLYAPKIKWQKWLFSGGEAELGGSAEGARQETRAKKRNDSRQDGSPGPKQASDSDKNDIRSNRTTTTDSSPPASTAKRNGEIKPQAHPLPRKGPLTHRLRNGLADMIEYAVGSDDVLYSLKFTAAVFLVTWPAFLPQWNAWYSLNRGLWAALQLVLVTEVAIGSSLVTFSLRAVGTTLGCVWGYIAYQAHHGNRVVCVVLLVIGIIPSTYVQLGSKYAKAGMVSIVSMCIVALATVDSTVPGSATENFLKRWIAFLIGGALALMVQFIIFPVRARDKLTESLKSAVSQIMEMEACLASGIERGSNAEVTSDSISKQFSRTKKKAEAALTSAETFLPFCINEPRLKGSFKGLALIYAEMLYVLHAIVDRMDNMMQLRHKYGSGIFTELNPQVHTYRRNVAGSITVILFLVREALATKLPIPQFLPSARLAHLRMINRVREVVLEKESDFPPGHDPSRSDISLLTLKNVLRQKFLSWNAFSAGQIEVIEFLEELTDLAKLLVGANEFRSGMLTRHTYRDYIDQVNEDVEGDHDHHESAIQDEEEMDEFKDMVSGDETLRPTHTRRRRTLSSAPVNEDGKKTPSEEKKTDDQEVEDDVLPISLQRVRSRRIEEMSLKRDRSNTLGRKRTAT